jgi:hypothetical protein
MLEILRAEVILVEEKPYFCPNCRSNRIKFSVLTSYSQDLLKDAQSGAVMEYNEPQMVAEQEPVIQCLVCRFIGNEMRFVKQAEREPRQGVTVEPAYR